jgi:ADP-heptose:LPS heptosyltransferase
MIQASNILLAKLRAIGDTVLTLPSLQALRKAYPHARISLLVPGHSMQLFEADPRVDEVIAYRRHDLGALQWKANVGFFRELQSRHFDLAVCLHASFRSGLLAWMSGAETRVVRNHSGRDWFSTLHPGEAKEPKSIVQRDFDALRALGITPKEEAPRLVLAAPFRRDAAALAKRAGLRRGKSVLIFPHAGKPEKEWPLERFEAAKAMLEKKGFKAAWVVAPEAPGPQGSLRAGHLLTLGALCQYAGWALGNDSGPRHIAAACGARTLTLFGPEALREWHPYSAHGGHVALQSPDGRMESISIQDLNKAVTAWLR